MYGGQQEAINNLMEHWQVALTMAFGSFIAGATSEGGGAFAFPVFTKVLHIIYENQAGMACNTLGQPGGLPGIILGTVWLAELLPSAIIRMTFTVMVSSFAVALFIMNHGFRQCNQALPACRRKEKNILLLTGFIGGIISGLVGNGIDIITFSVIVMLFRISEKIATPTPVLLMAINAITGFTIHLLIIGDFSPEIQDNWLAAIPIVVGVPTGAIFCSFLDRHLIAWILISIISVGLISSLWIIPLNQTVILYSSIVFIAFFSAYYKMSRVTTYLPSSLKEPSTQEKV